MTHARTVSVLVLSASSTFAQAVHFSPEEHLDAIDAALNLRPSPGETLRILARGAKEDPAPAIADARGGRTR
jgi:hypothetical protein